MKILIIILLAVCTISIHSQTVLTSIPSTLVDGKYIIKAGTTINANTNVIGKNVTITKVGVGANPIIKFAEYTGMSLQNSILENIDIESPPAMSPTLKLNNGKVTGCHLKGGHPAISPGGSKVVISNCKLSGSIYDALYCSGVDSLFILNTWVGDMYMGDGTDCGLNDNTDNVHTENCNFLYIDGLISDHSQYSGKFPLIFNGSGKVIIKNSDFYGTTNPCVYVGSTEELVEFYNCAFIGGLKAIENNGQIKVVNCLFANQTATSIWEGGRKEIRNCTFANISYDGDYANACIRSWNGDSSIIDNCIFYNSAQAWAGVNGKRTNCLYYKCFTRTGDKDIDPQFIDRINYKSKLGKGVIIDRPLNRYKPFIKPNWTDSLNKYKPAYDSLIIYKNTMNYIVIKGLKNTNQTKYSILLQINKIIK